MNFEKLSLVFWLNAGNLKQYATFLNTWYETVKGWLTFPASQFDIDTAHIDLVNLYAWQRDVQRFNSEPEWLYRSRVKHAYQNARDAGTVAGFKRIWARMGLGALEIEERIVGRDWDIVALKISDSVISDHPELLDIIIEKYGRTGRRYEWTTEIKVNLNIRSAAFGNTASHHTASLIN